MNKKAFFWIFLIIGIVWIIGVSYWYIYVNGIENIANIKWKENFSSKDPITSSFFSGVLLLIIPLLITALLFYFTGLFFGNEDKEVLKEIEQENEDLKSELAEYANKVENIKIIYTGGKIKKRAEKQEDKFEVIEEPEEINTNTPIPSPMIERDDLKVIEGIGEKIEFILNENGIYTWEQLSNQTAENLQNILIVYGGVAYKIHNTVEWPKQAKLFSKNK